MVGWSPRPGLAVGAVVLLVVGSLGLLAALGAAAPPPAPVSGHVPSVGASTVAPSDTKSSAPVGGGLARALAVENGLRAKGINPATVHLPDFAGMVTGRNRQVTPTYEQAPAPMGVADVGLMNRSGVLTPYVLNTTSVAGSVAMTNLQSLYVAGDGPDTFGIQLNSVVTNVTVFGNSSNQFWSQNYVDYTVSTQQLVFGDEVWNFSNSSGNFPQNSVYNFSANGTYGDFPYLYQGYGPTITIGYPFTLTLYLNTSILGDRPALYFNYTVSNSTFRQSSSYDYLVFNSTVGTPTSPAIRPHYQADGAQYDPIGLINDMEIDILGNDDGDTTVFTAANATASLQYWNATAAKMENVPSAINAGQETGETSVGLAVYSSGGAQPVGVVRSGPGFVGGLWNYSGAVGGQPVTLHLQPANGFLFVNVGHVSNVTTAQWVPTSPSGDTTFYLPSGFHYYLDFLMSNYDPTARTVSVFNHPLTRWVNMTWDPSLGVYTPLFALSNSELAGISSSGSGTVQSPYQLFNNQYGPLAPEFAQWDDYLFPVFPGLLLANTSAFVTAAPPSFEINIPSWEYGPPYTPINSSGLPSTNNLQIEFYDASNISLVNGTGITGWFSAFLEGYPESSVIIWSCNDILVAGNTFDDEGAALLLYGGTNNTIWRNIFVATVPNTADPSLIDNNGSLNTGLSETESGDLIFDNSFTLPIPAMTPTYDPFECDQYGYCYFVAYTDTWNVSREPATAYTYVNGWNLTGSIIGTSYQGGNYWSNYGTTADPFGVLPYNDSSQITVGGDYVPLVQNVSVLIWEQGLATGTTWSFTITGPGTVVPPIEGSGSVNGFGFSLAPGTYNFTAAASGYSVSPAEVSENVGIAGATVTFTFSPLSAYLTLSVTPSNASVWVRAESVNLGTNGVGELGTSSGPASIEATAPGYTPYFNNVTLVGGENFYLNITMGLVPSQLAHEGDGWLNLTVSPTSATLWVDGVSQGVLTGTGGRASVQCRPGLQSVEVTASGYYPYFNNVTVSSNRSTVLEVSLHPVTSGSSSSNGISDTAWYVIGALIVLAIALVLGLLVMARRPRKPATADAKAPAKPWQETATNSPGGTPPPAP